MGFKMPQSYLVSDSIFFLHKDNWNNARADNTPPPEYITNFYEMDFSKLSLSFEDDVLPRLTPTSP